MTAFRRVVVAYDGSPPAEDALALALRLCDPADGVLTLACAVVEHPWRLPGQRDPEAVPDDIASMLTEARDRLPAGIRVRQRAPLASSPARALTELAGREGVDLLVVGSSRHAQDGRVSLERTAGRLLHGSPCAVALPPAGLRSHEPFRHVGVAYDASPEAGLALSAAYRIAARSGAAVTIAHALAPVPLTADSEALAREARLEAQRRLDDAAEQAPDGVNPRTVLLHGRPADAIREAFDGIVDLLVTGSRGYGPMQRVLLGSVSEALADGAPQPALVLPRHTAPETASLAAAGAGAS